MLRKIKLLITCFTAVLLYTAVHAQFWTAANLSIIADGVTDQTHNIQTAIDRADVQTIWFSNSSNTGPALFRVDSIVNVPAGKVLKFEAGNRIKGFGTINGGVIDASLQSWIFDTSITVNPEATAHGWFSVKWFGAGNLEDNYFPIQRSINTCIRNKLERLHVPQGNYVIQHPLIEIGQVSTFFTLDISGETTVWGTQTNIIPTFNNTFALGIQLGKGCKVRNLRFVGTFTPPSAANAYEFFNRGWDDFVDTDPLHSAARDDRYSPFSAIVIDPFSNSFSTQPGTGDRYPGLDDYYQSPFWGLSGGPNSGSGSSGITIEEVSVTGFVVGICSSPNGITQNEEFLKVNRFKVENCKLGVSGGQDQEKMNIIDNVACWGAVHTLFATGLYGTTYSIGNWYITNVNIAQSLIRVIWNQQGGRFASHISNVYSESLGWFGSINSNNATQVSNCQFDFESYEDAGLRILVSASDKVTFKNCSFRYYGKSAMLMFNSAGATYEDCNFSGVPVEIQQFNNPGQVQTVYMNCAADVNAQDNKYYFGINSNVINTRSLRHYLNYNKLTIREQEQERDARHSAETYNLDGKDVFVHFYEPWDGVTLNYYHVVFSAAHTFIFHPPNANYYELGHTVLFSDPVNLSYHNTDVKGYGVITDISTSGDVTVKYISEGVIDGDHYSLSCLYPAVHSGTFMGNITGDNKIERVARDYGDVPADYKGFLIKAPYNNSTNGWVKIVDYTNPTPSDQNGGFFTTLGNYGTIFPSDVHDTMYFNNGVTKMVETNSKGSHTLADEDGYRIFYKGEIIVEMSKSDKATVYKVCKTGYKNIGGTNAPAGETRQAQICPDEPDWKTTGNSFTGTAPNNVFGTISNDDINIKTNSANVGIMTKDGKLGWGTTTPTKLLDVNGETRIRTLPASSVNQSIVFADGSGNLKALAHSTTASDYLSGDGTWQPIPIIGTGGIDDANQGLSLDGTTVVLGDPCNSDHGYFRLNREINMDNYNLYFNSSDNGKLYMGARNEFTECRELHTRLEISSHGLDGAANSYASPTPSLSGLRFTDLTQKTTPIDNRSHGVLSLDDDGDVIWVQECCAKGKKQMDDVLNQMKEMRDELNAVKNDLKAKGLEIQQLKSKLDRKLKGNKIFMIGAALFAVIFGGHVIPGGGK